MDGAPSGAVGRDHDIGFELLERVECRRDDRLEQRPVEVEPAYDRVYACLAGEPLCVAADVDDARVAAAGAG